jgi:hypothetical protein
MQFGELWPIVNLLATSLQSDSGREAGSVVPWMFYFLLHFMRSSSVLTNVLVAQNQVTVMIGFTTLRAALALLGEVFSHIRHRMPGLAGGVQ